MRKRPAAKQAAGQLDLWDGMAPAPVPAAPRTPAPKAGTPAPAVKRQAGRLALDLSRRSGLMVSITLTRNRSTVLSVRYPHGRRAAQLRLHEVFADAPEPVREALGTWLRAPKDAHAGQTIDAFIAAQRGRIQATPSRRPRLRTQGRHFDLAAVMAAENARHFGDRVDARITWGRRPTRPPRSSIRLGSYCADDHLIRIHPHLDRPFVPAYLVRFVVFHEMLHADLGIESAASGRRRIHPRAFREREARHPDCQRASAWLEVRANMAQLLSVSTRRRT